MASNKKDHNKKTIRRGFGTLQWCEILIVFQFSLLNLYVTPLQCSIYWTYNTRFLAISFVQSIILLSWEVFVIDAETVKTLYSCKKILQLICFCLAFKLGLLISTKNSLVNHVRICISRDLVNMNG